MKETEIVETLTRIDERMGRMEDSLDLVVERLMGNGEPGLMTRVDRIEQKECVRSRMFWVVVTAMAAAIMSGGIAVLVWVIRAMA